MVLQSEGLYEQPNRCGDGIPPTLKDSWLAGLAFSVSTSCGGG
jgi:hypothetical protein